MADLASEVNLLKNLFSDFVNKQGIESVIVESVSAAIEDGSYESLNEVECYWLKEALNQTQKKTAFQGEIEQVIEAIWLAKKDNFTIPAFVKRILSQLYP